MTGHDEGLEYFRDAQALTDGLDGAEVIRGFLDGIKDAAPPVGQPAIRGGLPWRSINGGRG